MHPLVDRRDVDVVAVFDALATLLRSIPVNVDPDCKEEEDDEEPDGSTLRGRHDTYYRSALRDLTMTQTMRSSQGQ